MANRHDAVSAISPAKESWSIIVRVVRLWFVSDFSKQKLPFSMEMVLMDDKGDKIHASIRKTLIYKFDKELKEGFVYSISNFGVACNGGSFRTTRHDYKLNFQIGTKVLNIDRSFVSCSPYSLIPFAEINDTFDTNYLIDVMGFFTGVGTERQYERNGLPVKMNVIELESDGFKIECALFGSYVDDLNSFLATGEVQRPVVILQLAKVKPFQGKIQLQNAMSCTKILFNPDCVEVAEFKKRVCVRDDSPSQALSQLPETPKISLEDEFLCPSLKKTVQGVKECKEENFAVVLATIKYILEEGEWWYTACTCSKAVYPDSKMFFCEKCNRHVLTVVPRYRIKVRVVDETDSATFVIFDRDAGFLLNKTCSDMVDSLDKDPATGSLPKEIIELVDKTFLFKVDIRNGHSSRFDHSFRVKRLCADSAIIEKFKQLKSTNLIEEGVTEVMASDGVMQDLMPKFVDAEVDSQVEVAYEVRLGSPQNLEHGTLDVTPVKRGLDGEGHVGEESIAEIPKKVIKVEKD